MRVLPIGVALLLFASGASAQSEIDTVATPDDSAVEKVDESTDGAAPQTEETAEGSDGDQAGPPSEESAGEGESEDESEGVNESSSGDVSSSEEVSLEQEAPLVPRISGRWRSELLLSQRARMVRLGSGRYAMRNEKGNVYPFYNTINLRADDIGVRGLAVQFQGWAGLDLANVHFEQRFVADPTYLYLQYRNYGLDVRLGRQAVYGGAARGIKIDGLNANYLSPINLGFQLLGGLVVEPHLGPDWYRGQSGSRYENFGRGMSDWGREGEFSDYAFGGRLYYQLVGSVNVGLSLLQTMRDKEIDKQLIGADLDLAPFDWASVSADALMDLQRNELVESNVAIDVYPTSWLDVALDYRHADPTLYLSSLSIFSVFSDEEYDSVGGQVRLKAQKWLLIHGGYHHRFYSSIETSDNGIDHKVRMDNGFDVDGGVRVGFGESGGFVLLDYRRFTQSDEGMNQIRVGTMVPLEFLLVGLRASVNGYLDLYDEDLSETTERSYGIMGDLGLFWTSGGWQTGASMTAAMTPYAQGELRGLLKFGYNFDFSFSHRSES